MRCCCDVATGGRRDQCGGRRDGEVDDGAARNSQVGAWTAAGDGETLGALLRSKATDGDGVWNKGAHACEGRCGRDGGGRTGARALVRLLSFPRPPCSPPLRLALVLPGASRANRASAVRHKMKQPARQAECAPAQCAAKARTAVCVAPRKARRSLLRSLRVRWAPAAALATAGVVVDGKQSQQGSPALAPPHASLPSRSAGMSPFPREVK